ncbi:hypothetical protein D2V93_08465 [Flagellimonas taeanensis]|uniref:hypothetical protein n=1 Tax=Flagellimonas taeanensis TaxID=1005926 RepID=UPI000E68BC2B|nr:hypothetical protein [Allomuricauda taeanensis]RIV50894.1 hypothetical protein D2V93_08465 [Allomuricauda taeanensis]
MIIIHNEAKENFHVSYSEWFRDYVKTGTFKNYTVTHPRDVVELHKINPDTGEMVFNTLMDKKEAENTKRIEPRKYHVRNLEFKFYDRNLVFNKEYFKLHPNSSIRHHFERDKKKSKSTSFLGKIFLKLSASKKSDLKEKSEPFTRYEIISLWLMGIAAAAAIIIPILLYIL